MGLISPLAGSVGGLVAADGTCTIRVGADKPFTSYHITYLSVQNDGAKNCVATVYRGFVAPTTLVETSSSGNGDISDTVYDLQTAEFLSIVFSGATVGSRCLVVVQGTQEYGGA